MSPLRGILKKNTHLPVLQKRKEQPLQIYPPRNTSNSPPDLGDNFEKRVQNLVKAREETVTTPPPEESKQTVATPPSVPKEPTLHKEESPSEYPFEEHPETPLGTEDELIVPPTNMTQCVLPDDPFSRFCLGHTVDTSDKNQRSPRWWIRKPERRHSVDLEELDKQYPRPH